MIRRALPVFALASLAACSSTPPPQTFPPLDYSYLPPITLRVANVNVTNAYVPDPGAATLLGQDPEPPANALLQVLNQRLLPSGAPGTANATIETASIDQIGSNLTGTLTVQLNVATPDGRHTGYTEASVTQTDPAPDPTSSYNQVQAALYQLTKELMDQMNTQLQYQIQHNLSVWVVGGAGFNPNTNAAPGNGGPSGGIQAAPLGPVSAPSQAAPATTLPGGISPTAIPPGPPIQLAPEGPSPTPTPPAPTAIPPAPTAPTAPAAPAAPTPPAAPAPPQVYNPNAGPGM
jgi:hypothetical protein